LFLTLPPPVLVAEPESFLVDNANHLLAGELDRARDGEKQSL
jgi:hypothetical protein